MSKMSIECLREELEQNRKDYIDIILGATDSGSNEYTICALLNGIQTELRYISDVLSPEEDFKVIDFPAGFRGKTEKPETD